MLLRVILNNSTNGPNIAFSLSTKKLEVNCQQHLYLVRLKKSRDLNFKNLKVSP